MLERKWWTLIVVCVGIFMLLLDVTIVNVALPDIQRDLHSTFSQLQWVIDAYALSLAALVLTAGSLADLWGRKLVFAGGVIVFTGGSLLCGIAPNATLLVLARGLQGDRWGDDVRHLARAARARVPRSGARHGVRDLGRDDGRRGRDRARSPAG